MSEAPRVIAPDQHRSATEPVRSDEPTDGKPAEGGADKHEVGVAIPLAAESLNVSKRVIDTGRGVRVVKTVFEREEIVDEPLEHEQVVVERIPIGKVLAAHEVPSVRQEGNVTVIPVLEEVLVTERRLLLKEEVRVIRVRREVHQPQRVVLRSEEASVEHFDQGNAPSR